MKALVFVLAMVLANVILGIALAIKDGTFRVRELPRFLRTEILPYYLGLLALAALAQVEDLQGLGTKPLAWAAIAAYAGRVVFGEIKDKVFELFGVGKDDLEIGGTG